MPPSPQRIISSGGEDFYFNTSGQIACAPPLLRRNITSGTANVLQNITGTLNSVLCDEKDSDIPFKDPILHDRNLWVGMYGVARAHSQAFRRC